MTCIRSLARQETKVQQLKTPADSTMIKVCAKIGMTRDIVSLGIAVFIFMIVPIIKLGGSSRRSSRKLKDSVGRE